MAANCSDNPEPEENLELDEAMSGSDTLGVSQPNAENANTTPRPLEPLGDMLMTNSDGSIYTSLSAKLEGVRAQKVDANTVRQRILSSPLTYKDVSMKSYNRSGLLDKLSQLEANIEAAVDVMLDEKITCKCTNCDQMEGKLTATESAKEDALSALEETWQKHELLYNSVDGLQRKCEQYEEIINSFEARNEELVSELSESREESNLIAAEAICIDASLRKVEHEFRAQAQELDKLSEQRGKISELNSRLEATVELLVADYRNATEKLVDLDNSNAIAEAAVFENNEVTNKYISELEEEKEVLRKEVKKINRDRFIALDRVNVVARQHNGVIEKLNKRLTDSEQQVATLEKSLSESATSSAATIQAFESQVIALNKENDDAMSTITDLTTRSMKLNEELENAMAKNAELVAMKEELVAAEEKSDKSARKLTVDVEALGSEKADLEKRLNNLVQSEKMLVQLHKGAEANLKRMSDEVVFVHEEISRLSMEKNAIGEEADAQLQKANARLDELETENKCTSKEYQELWARSNTSLLEKESAMATAEKLQREKEELEPSKEREKQELQEQIQNMTEEREILHEMNRVLESEKEVAVELARKELEVENENLRREIDAVKREKDMENENLRQEMDTVKIQSDGILQSYTMERDRMQNEVDDMNWKINALTQNMSVRLREKDSIISQLETHIQGYRKEEKMLKNEIQKRDANKTSQVNALPNLVSMIEEQQIELEQKDVLVSNLRAEESRAAKELKAYKSEILRMQTKLESLEEWFHDSLSFASPPSSPNKMSSNPVSPQKSYSNPQSPSKGTPKRYGPSR